LNEKPKREIKRKKMKTFAYIVLVKNKEAIAMIETSLKNGAEIKYATAKSLNALNADREFDLVNASPAKISRAKKYAHLDPHLTIAEFINSEECEIVGEQ